MEDSAKQEQILKFLNKNYVVKDNMIQDKLGNQYWGKEVLKKLPIIFSFESEYCDVIFDCWCISNGIEDWYQHVNCNTKQLNTTWSPELAQEIAAFSHIDAEAELIAILSDQIAREIDAQILKDLKGQVGPDDFMGLVKCVGYNNLTIYEQTTHRPRKIFMSMKKQDIEYERQNNTFWQDWVRAREQDKKT